MADVYCYSGAAGAADGTSWANAYTTLQAAMTGAGAGGKVYVAHDHLETGAVALAITSPGTLASPQQIVCVNRAGSVPPVAADVTTGAIIRTTGGSNMTRGGIVGLCQGLTFEVGDGSSAAQFAIAAAGNWNFTNCTMKLLTTNNSSFIRVGGSHGEVWLNCTYHFSNVSQGLLQNVRATLIGGSLTGTSPNNLWAGSGIGSIEVIGMDLTNLNSKNFGPNAPIANALVAARNCKLPATFTWMASVQTTPIWEFLWFNCDDGSENYQHGKQTYYGKHIPETTIVRTGGATDGVTPISWRIDTTASCKETTPFRCMDINQWLEPGTKIATVYGVWGGGAVPNNNDIWLEAHYLGSSSFPQSSFVSDGRANQQAAIVAQESDTSVWGGSTTKFKLSVAFSSAMRGIHTFSVGVGAASSTFYIDPKVVIS